MAGASTADRYFMRAAPYVFVLAAATCSASSFHFDVGVYFGVPEREVIVVREQRVPDIELPVVFLIARHTRAAPSAVVSLRLAGVSWWDIAERLRANPEIFVVAAGPPYGRAQSTRRKHRLPDAQIIEFANVRFLSEYHRVPVERIYAMRSRGLDYVAVNSALAPPVRERRGGRSRHSGDH